MLETLLPGAQHLQNLHPLVVHFPLAFLPVAVLVYILAWAAGRPSWARLALSLLVLGTIGAAAAAATGLYVEEAVMVDPSVRERLLDVHERWMLITLSLSVVLTAWAVIARPLPVRGRGWFLLLLLALLAILTHGADFGGRMVYDYNAGGNACGQPIPFTR